MPNGRLVHAPVKNRKEAHFMPDDDDRAHEIMNAFFEPVDKSGSAQNVPTAATRLVTDTRS